MSKENGFLQHRRGIWEHVRDGRMSLQDVAIHQYIAAQADTRTGIWKGSAGALAGELSLSPRIARRFLERLSRGDYLKRFPVPGKHVCYPILVHKFHIADGEHRGEHLDALSSTDSRDLRYYPCDCGEQRGEQLSSQKRLETRDKGLKPAQKPAAPPDSRFQPFFAYAYKAYEAKNGRKPLWLGKDKNGLKSLLAGASATVLPIERLTGLWDSFLASTETFTTKQGDSLGWFCSNLDKFSNGPILEGGTNGKLVNFAKQRSEGNARAIESVLGRFEETPSDIRRALPAANK